jgi:hypothetical protein
MGVSGCPTATWNRHPLCFEWVTSAATPSCRTAPWQGWRVIPHPLRSSVPPQHSKLWVHEQTSPTLGAGIWLSRNRRSSSTNTTSGGTHIAPTTGVRLQLIHKHRVLISRFGLHEREENRRLIPLGEVPVASRSFGLQDKLASAQRIAIGL